MFSSHRHLNILTALLTAHGVRHAVVCPGSRNAPIVHNFNECPDMACHPVTDERSAAFYALGMAQATGLPVVVCVTSGTALLNVAPAVAEAFYQHHSLIIISADRPAAWIGQLDGQTLCQPGALAPWVATTVNLPEVGVDADSTDAAWHCNRLVNEALIEAFSEHRPCVHINVPISEPLFRFTVSELPAERVVRRYAPTADYDCLPQTLIDDFLKASRPIIVFGQYSTHNFRYEGIDTLFSHVIVLHEALAPFTSVSHIDEVLSATITPQQTAQLLPDFILYVGDAIVSKRLKAFLRKATEARTWRVSTTGKVEDTFQNLRGLLVGDVEFVLQSLSNKLSKLIMVKACNTSACYRRRWLHLLTKAHDAVQQFAPPYSQMAAVRLFEQQVATLGVSCQVHYANSQAIRLANVYARRHVWCNRGVNGIEGSLSTAAGFSVVHEGMVCCVVGDLSFFYDQNALWNQNLQGNLRILLLNNSRGGIFNMLRGLEQSPARDRLVAAEHKTSAEGICRQNGVIYLKASDMDEMQKGIDTLLNIESERPVLLEAFTDPNEDERVLRNYYRSLSI